MANTANSPLILVVDDYTMALVITEMAKQTERSAGTLDYVQVLMQDPLVGKVMDCAMQKQDGTILQSQVQESGVYRVEDKHGLWLAVQHGSYFVKSCNCSGLGTPPFQSEISKRKEGHRSKL
jgi:hypothetical protein